MNPLDTVFANLNRWRDFSAYQLERRDDIFFSVYLKGPLRDRAALALAKQESP